MTGSQAGGPASGGAVAFGIALLFAIGVFGFYRLTETTRSRHVPAPPIARPDVEPTPSVPAASAVLAVQTTPTDPAPGVPTELPDIFPTPTMMTGSLPRP